MKKVKATALAIIINRFTSCGFLHDYRLEQIADECEIPIKKLRTIIKDSDIFIRKHTGWRIRGFSKIITEYFTYQIRLYNKTGNLKSLCYAILESLAINKLKQQMFSTRQRFLDTHGGKSKKLFQAHLKERTIECRTSSRSLAKTLGISHTIANSVLNSLKKQGIAVFKNYSQCKSANRMLRLKTGTFLCQRNVLAISCPNFNGYELFDPQTPLLCKASM